MKPVLDPLPVALTFDIEFDINGALSSPASAEPLGRPSLGDLERGATHGLGYVLDALDDHGLRATFFIEALQTAWFGDREMGEVAAEIAARGHETQLHLHPVWLLFDNADWADAARKDPPATATHDSLTVLPGDRVREILARGIEVFRRWGLPQPTAVRTGSLITERQLYREFASAGLEVSSSVGCGIHLPGHSSLHRMLAPETVEGVLEIPVTSYVSYDPLLRERLKLATLIGMGTRELRFLLQRATRLDAPCLVVLSHASEFPGPRETGFAKAAPSAASTFRQLCEALARGQGCEAVTIGELAARLRGGGADDLRITVPRRAAASRYLERLLP